MKLGFIGLGRIGTMLAGRLANAGYELVLFDVHAAVAAERAVAYRADTAASPGAVAARADVVVISVPGPKQASEVMLGQNGVLSQAKSSAIVIDTTTGTIDHSREIARKCDALGVAYLDAPVSIGGDGAITVMVGGSERAYRGVAAILNALASHVAYLGGNGNGTLAKLLNQSIYISYMAAFAEGLIVGESLGLSRDALLAALGHAAAGHPHIMTKYPEIEGRSADRFAIVNALRYLRDGAEAYRAADYATPIFDAATRSLAEAVPLGAGGEDIVVARNRYIRRRKPMDAGKEDNR